MSKTLYQLAPGVRRSLDRLNVSQKRLAERLEISPAYVSQLLNGRRFPSPEIRRRFQELLPDLPFDQLFEEVE